MVSPRFGMLEACGEVTCNNCRRHGVMMVLGYFELEYDGFWNFASRDSAVPKIAGSSVPCSIYIWSGHFMT